MEQYYALKQVYDMKWLKGNGISAPLKNPSVSKDTHTSKSLYYFRLYISISIAIGHQQALEAFLMHQIQIFWMLSQEEERNG